jgi:hypothetical protein
VLEDLADLADEARQVVLDIQRVAWERASTWQLPVGLGLVDWYLPQAGPFWYSGEASDGLNWVASSSDREGSAAGWHEGPGERA